MSDNKGDKAIFWILGGLVILLIGGFAYKQYLEMRIAGSSVSDALLHMMFIFFAVVLAFGLIAAFVFYFLIPKGEEIHQGFKKLKSKKQEQSAKELPVSEESDDTSVHAEESDGATADADETEVVVECEDPLQAEINRQAEAAQAIEEKQRRDYENSLIQLYGYTDVTFKKILTPKQRQVLINNIINLSKGNKEFETVEKSRSEYVTSLDLCHFGWNIGKRVRIPGCNPNHQNEPIAAFLKTSFPFTYKKSSLSTIATKLSYEDGKYSLPKIPEESELKPHVFPKTEDFPDKTD